MTLNWFDFGIIAVVVLSILISFFRGFLRESISLITWIAGLFVAIRYAPDVADLLDGIVRTQALKYVIAFVLLFFSVFAVGLLINVLVKRGVDATGFSFADRMMGGAFGAARGILLVAVMLLFVTMTTFKDAEAVTGSELSPTFMPLVSWLDGFLPDQLQTVTKWMAIDTNPIATRQKRRNNTRSVGRGSSAVRNSNSVQD